MRYTYRELLNHMEALGYSLAFVALGRLMDIIEENTGIFPEWCDLAPLWVVNECLGIVNR